MLCRLGVVLILSPFIKSKISSTKVAKKHLISYTYALSRTTQVEYFIFYAIAIQIKVTLLQSAVLDICRYL